MADEKYLKKFEALTCLPPDEQAREFLLSFILEFQGRSEEVLDLNEEFKGFLRNPPPDGDDVDLEQDQAHLFLERRGETHTATELREKLKKIDLDSNNRLCFLEYALFNYEKTLEEFFTNREKGAPPAELLKALDEAIAAYRETLAKRKAEEARRAELEELAKGTGVKAMRAKAELEQARARGFTSAQNYAEVRAKYQKKKADKAVKEADGSEALRKAQAEEQARLKAEAEKKAAEEKAKRNASRAKLANKAGAFAEAPKEEMSESQKAAMARSEARKKAQESGTAVPISSAALTKAKGDVSGVVKPGAHELIAGAGHVAGAVRPGAHELVKGAGQVAGSVKPGAHELVAGAGQVAGSVKPAAHELVAGAGQVAGHVKPSAEDLQK